MVYTESMTYAEALAARDRYFWESAVDNRETEASIADATVPELGAN